MPAAAVIPALIVNTKIAAVKKLVVGFWGGIVYKWYFGLRGPPEILFSVEVGGGWLSLA